MFGDGLLLSQGGSRRRTLVIFAQRQQNHFVMNGRGPSFRCLKMCKPMNCEKRFDSEQTAMTVYVVSLPLMPLGWSIGNTLGGFAK